MMEAAALRRFEELIRARSGIQMRAPEAGSLSQTLRAQMTACGFQSADRYLDFLSSPAPDAGREWTTLFKLLTNQESYFFRDSEQLSVIRERVFPALIERNRGARTLRIWSAGCSTGEEPYSLAMMLEDALPSRDEWRILILGTDISESALARARRGVYGAWSFRALDGERRDRFFTPRGKEWEVKPHLRESVTFQSGNLFGDAFPCPSNHLHDMDLIVCRNVFIYFGRDEVAQVLQKFSATLHPAGFLVTGHAELHGAPLGDLQARSFPQSVVYQRQSAATRAANSPDKREFPPAPILRAAPPFNSASSRAANPVLVAKQVALPREMLLPAARIDAAPPQKAISPAPPQSGAETDLETQITSLIRAGRARAAMEKLTLVLGRDPKNLVALCLAAQALANLGQLDEAETYCRRAIAVSSFTALPYQVLARIAGERGDEAGAKSLLKKVIYLSPSSVRAYLELSALYGREGDAHRAAQMRRAALEVLDGQSADVLVSGEEYAIEERLTVGEIKRQLQVDGESE